jgi:uncharacterized membrane protein
MSPYFVLKAIHIMSAAVLFGTGLGIAFFKWITDRTDNVAAIRVLAGACWIPVVWLQIRMRDLARRSEREGHPIPAAYRAYARVWFWLGVPAFAAVALVFWMMVAKPRL